MTIGEKIYLLRTKNSLTQKQFAQSIGASQSAVNYWENGKRLPRIDQIQKIADFFGITPDSLISEKNEVIKQTPFNCMFGTYYDEKEGVADIHFTTEEYTLDELEYIRQFAEFIKSNRKKSN